MRALKWIGVSIAALLALLAVAGAILIATFDPNDYKDRVAAAIEDRTGRSVTIGENIDWSLFPWLAIEAGDITVGNHPDFSAFEFASIDRLSARVRVLPLLRRQLEFGVITIDGLSLDVGTNEAGVTNWSDLLEQQPAGGASGSGASPASSNIELEIAGIRLRGARVLWRDKGEVRYILSDGTLTA